MPPPDETVSHWLERLIRENDRRYSERFEGQERAVAAAMAAAEKAVAAAMAAQEKAISAALMASEKAIGKAQQAQEGVNMRQNEFRASLDDYTKLMLPRLEADASLKEIRNLIAVINSQVEELRRGASHGSGATEATAQARQSASRVTALLISTALSILGLLGTWAFLAIRALGGNR